MRKRWPKERTMDAVVRRGARLGVKGEGPDQISRMLFGVIVFTRTVLAEPQETALVTGNSHPHRQTTVGARQSRVPNSHARRASYTGYTRTRLASSTSYGLGHRPGGLPPFFFSASFRQIFLLLSRVIDAVGPPNHTQVTTVPPGARRNRAVALTRAYAAVSRQR